MKNIKIYFNKDIIQRKFIIFTIITLIITYIVSNMLSIYIFSLKDQKCKADVVIVLGASTNQGKVSLVYQERINHGISLYKGGYVKKIIVTGGKGKGNKISDAYAAKEYIISKGIYKKDILLEETSTITQENLENAKIVMDKNNYKTAIVVSDPLHMKRAMLLATDIGIDCYSSPTPSSRYISLKSKFSFLIREVFFYVGYKWWRIFN